MNTQRPLSVAIAAILLALLSVLIDLSFPLCGQTLSRGMTEGHRRSSFT